MERVVRPRPTSGQSPPGRTYQYPSASETRVQVDGLSPASGFARKVSFDALGRLLTDTDATAGATTLTWVGETDLAASRTDAANRRTTFAYDSAFRPPTPNGPNPSDAAPASE